MKTSILMTLAFISVKFQHSGCSSNTITPENPNITVVLGHNSTNVMFQWRYTLKRREEITNFNIERKYKGATKKTFLVRFDIDRNYSKLNSLLYTFTHNYTQGSLSGYFSFTIKDITKQEDNTDGSKFRYLSDELSYFLEINYLNDPDSRRESKIQLWILSLPRIFYLTAPPIYTRQGDSITLRCNTSGHPAPRATWIHKDTNTVIAHSSVTSFNITGKASGGKYCCHVTNLCGDATNCTSISVMDPPEITNCLINGTLSTSHPVFEGDVITVACATSGSPPLTGKWTKNGRVWNGNELTFNPIHRADAGSYTFTLRTGDYWKEAVQEVLITVHYLDDLQVIGSSNKSYSQSNPVVLFNLSVNAFPSNTTLTCNSSVPNTMTVITRYNVGFLVFVIIENGTDSASIVCKAEHSVGTREETLHYYKRRKAEENTKVAFLGAILAVSIVLNISFIAVIIWLCRTKDEAHKGTRSNNRNEERRMNERSLQETGFNTEDNEIPNVLEYEPIGRQEGETRNAGIPEYEAMPAKTQPADQPHSGVLATDQTGLYKSTGQQGGTENDSNPSSVTYQTIQPRTGDYASLSPSTRLPPKGTSTGSPTRTGEY